MNITNILFIYFDKYFNLCDLATNRAVYFIKKKKRKETFMLLDNKPWWRIMAKPPPSEDRYRIDRLIEKTMRPKILKQRMSFACT